MKFRRATISGFAGVARSVTVDLDAQVVVLLGSNGFGKSTICDALAWALTGAHPRGADPRSWYGSGETFVELEVLTSASEAATVRRIVSNPGEESLKRLKTSVIVRREREQLRGIEADRWLSSWLQNATGGADFDSELEDKAITGQTDSFYLQQDSLRAFLATRSDDERFAALSQMVGARALSDLVAAFDSANRAWTKSVAQESSDVDRLRAAVDAVGAEISATERRLENARALGFSTFEAWTSRVLSHLAAFGLDESTGVASSPAELASLLERSIAAQGAMRRDLDRLKEQVRTIQSRLASPPQRESVSESDVLALERNLQGLETVRLQATATVEEARQQLQAAQTRVEELRALAELALRHVSDKCPTCGQDVDPDELIARLSESIGGGTAIGLAGEGERLAQANQARDAVLTAIRAATTELEEARAARDAQRRADLARATDTEALARLRNEVGRIVHNALPANSQETQPVPDDAVLAIDGWIAAASEMLNEFRTLEPALALTSTEDRMASLVEEESRRRAEYARARQGVEARQRTQALAESLLRGLRKDSENFLNERLRAIQPILDQLYAAIDPHPTLRGMSLETRSWYGKNRLSPVLVDSAADVRVDDPGRTLSTSQANALAVTLFLAFNLGLQPTRVTSVILDDPLQNLDDVHLLGLVDLLRRVQSHRQIIVTTHDATFADLLARKMRPTDAGERLNLIRLEAWDREGPRIINEQVQVDPRPIKLAVS
ncbi:AAA family ATPase [Nocardioides renjunii]|uniref:AAA family ATPase n=1 Tax=Nocardioides renjunii TaxID=3095075 RepID=UPI002AFEB85E|nr:AAA family ATPase [Nocardioides sp. S-34]WQQ22411.1 AAA family ATPase [Nocardioides sp. S-34]